MVQSVVSLVLAPFYNVGKALTRTKSSWPEVDPDFVGVAFGTVGETLGDAVLGTVGVTLGSVSAFTVGLVNVKTPNAAAPPIRNISTITPNDVPNEMPPDFFAAAACPGRRERGSRGS